MIVHDLRNPIGNISALANILKEDKPLDHLEKHDNIVKKIIDLGDFILQMVEELLDITSIEQGELSLNFAPETFYDILLDSLNRDPNSGWW